MKGVPPCSLQPSFRYSKIDQIPKAFSSLGCIEPVSTTFPNVSSSPKCFDHFLWPFTGSQAILHCHSSTREIKTGNSVPGVAQQGLSEITTFLDVLQLYASWCRPGLFAFAAAGVQSWPRCSLLSSRTLGSFQRSCTTASLIPLSTAAWNYTSFLQPILGK